MDTASGHRPILKRTGTVLVGFSLLDTAVMVYCLIVGQAYASSLNVFGVVAGIFLMRGSLGAASLIRWSCAFLLSMTAAAIVAVPLVFPVDLMRVVVRLNPGIAATSAAIFLLSTGLAGWMYLELGREPVLAAQSAAGKKVRRMRWPWLSGAAAMFLLALLASTLSTGELAQRALAMAKTKLGPGYRYHVVSAQVTFSQGETRVSATVAAWNEREVRNLPLQWVEP